MIARPYAEVIGDPIAHSKSPLIHNFWLQKLGIDAEYRKTHILAEELATYFAQRKADSNWRGCNVTIPHKQAVMAFLGGIDPDAVRIGAVNSVVGQAGLYGHNTDVIGIIESLRTAGFIGQSALIIGAGGAARAALAAFRQLEIPNLTIANRNLGTARQIHDVVIALDSPLPPVDLLFNATSLGMTGQPSLDLDLRTLPQTCTVLMPFMRHWTQIYCGLHETVACKPLTDSRCWWVRRLRLLPFFLASPRLASMTLNFGPC